MGVLNFRCFYTCAMYSFIFFIIQEDFSFMAPVLHHNLQVQRRKGLTLFLAFFWLGGILFGLWISCYAGDPLLSMMRSAVVSSVSIVGLMLAAALPFLLSAFAVFISGPGWLLPVSFVDGFLYGFACLTVVRAYGSAGWLIRPILCFSICASAPLTYIYWLRRVHNAQKPSVMETFFFLSCAVLIASIDYSLISSFLAELIF